MLYSRRVLEVFPGGPASRRCPDRGWFAVLVGILALAPWSGRAAVTTNGSLVVWGQDNPGNITSPPDTAQNSFTMAGGGLHGLAVRGDGTVVTWGFTTLNGLSVPSGVNRIIGVAAGLQHSVALRSNSTVVAWGQNLAFQTNVPVGLSNVVAITAMGNHSSALRSDGTVVSWGSNDWGETDPQPGLTGLISVSAGLEHTLACNSAGRVFAWGHNNFLQADPPAEFAIGTLKARAVAAGGYHSLALLQSGHVVAWGDHSHGATAVPFNLSGVRAIAAGLYHSVALLSNRTVVAWGDQTFGQSIVPPGLTNVIAIAAGDNFTLALVAAPPVILSQPVDVTVAVGDAASFAVEAEGAAPIRYQWRRNGTAIPGATNPVYNIDFVANVHAGTYSVAITNVLGGLISSNAVLTVSSAPQILVPPSGTNVLAGQRVVFEVLASGSAPLRYFWYLTNKVVQGGTNPVYSIAAAVATNAGPYSVVVSNAYGRATSDVFTLTVNQLPTILVPPQRQVAAAGSAVTFSVQASNAVTYQWRTNGIDWPGAFGPALALTSVQPRDEADFVVVVGNDFGSVTTAPVRLSVITYPPAGSQLAVQCAGQTEAYNGVAYVSLDPPPNLPEFRALAMGQWHTLGLTTNRGVLGWGDNSLGQAAAPSGLTNVLAIAAGGHHSLAVTNGGRVVGWGNNSAGQATPPVAATNVLMVAAGAAHSLALRANGTVVGWGDNTGGRATPPAGTTSIRGIAAGGEHSLAVRTNGTVVAWGGNLYGQTRVPAALAGATAVAAGAYHSVALRSNGTVIAWGRGDLGQTNVPPGLTNVIAISCGANHSVALRRDGTVVGWGSNNEGQLDDLAAWRNFRLIAAGGDRTCGVRPKSLVLGRPVPGAPALIRIPVSNEGGGTVDTNRAGRLSAFVSPNPVISVTNWVRLTNGVVVTNSAVWVEDRSLKGDQRFYRVLESP